MKISNLKVLRKDCNLTLREVEKKTGISNAYLSQLENGKIDKPSFDVIIKLLDLYLYILNGETPTTFLKEVVSGEQFLKCPVCKSIDIKDISPTESNGVFGSGYSIWKTVDIRKCNKCGVLFQPIDE